VNSEVVRNLRIIDGERRRVLVNIKGEEDTIYILFTSKRLVEERKIGKLSFQNK